MAASDEQAALTTVLGADVADFDDWRATDPDGAEHGLARTRRSFEAMAEKYHGELANDDGPVLRATFLNAADAVSAAVAMHDAVDEANDEFEEEDKVDLRAGVALGLVNCTDASIEGDGVDSADTLRNSIGPGDIAITGSVFEQAGGRFGGSFRGAGVRTLGGEEASVYRYAPEGAGKERARIRDEHVYQTPDERARASVQAMKQLYRNVLLGGVVILALLLVNVAASGADFWFQWPSFVIVVILFLQALRVIGPEGIGGGMRRFGAWFRQRSRWHERAESDLRERLLREGMNERTIRYRMRGIRGFRKRAASFGVIVVFLFAINLLTSPGTWWVVWPALALAFVLCMNAIKVCGVEAFLGSEWEEKKREELREKYERDSS